VPYAGQRAIRPGQSTRYAEQPPRGDYYGEVEDATPTLEEYQEDWSDDTASMRYGDWENEQDYTNTRGYASAQDYAPPPSRPREMQEMSPAAQRIAQTRGKNDPLATRELYRVSPEAGRGIPENQRSAQPRERASLPAPMPSSQPVQRGPQRTTQPLRLQQVARLQAEVQARTPRVPRAVRPDLAAHESGAEYAILPASATVACPICHGAGFLRSNVPFGHPQFGKAVPCQCKEQERKRKRRQQLLELSNLGTFTSKRFETFNPRVASMQEAYETAVNFAQGPDGWLFLVGPNGCGKTHLAAAIANQCLDAGSVVLFATVPDLLDHLRAAFAPDASEVYDQLFGRMREAEVLVLDDLGTQQSSPWASEKLFQLLNYRYNAGFPTVITANPRGWQATDERIRSRLSDISLVITINLERARDYRPNNPRRE
jgi:DNA replication protein DnaC